VPLDSSLRAGFPLATMAAAVLEGDFGSVRRLLLDGEVNPEPGNFLYTFPAPAPANGRARPRLRENAEIILPGALAFICAFLVSFFLFRCSLLLCSGASLLGYLFPFAFPVLFIFWWLLILSFFYFFAPPPPRPSAGTAAA